jgi:hypothetical protein
LRGAQRRGNLDSLKRSLHQTDGHLRQRRIRDDGQLS